MTRLLLLLLAAAFVLPATASAASLSLTTPPDSTYSSAKATVTTTVSGTTDAPPIGQPGQHVSILLDGTSQPCAATIAAEQQQSDPDNRYGGSNDFEPVPGPFSQQLSIDIVNVTSPSEWKLCGYIMGPDADSAAPAAAASTGTFTLTNPKAPTGANRAGFSFIVAYPRAAKPSMTLHPGDKLWLGGSFAYGVNQFACAGADNRLYWFSDAFQGATHRSHGAPALLGQTDSLSGLTLKWTLSKQLKPGRYAIQMACADGSLATPKRYLTVETQKSQKAKKKRRHKRR